MQNWDTNFYCKKTANISVGGNERVHRWVRIEYAKSWIHARRPEYVLGVTTPQSARFNFLLIPFVDKNTYNIENVLFYSFNLDS